MTRLASNPSIGVAVVPSSRPSGLDEVLIHVQKELDAVAVGISAHGGSLSMNVSRSDSAARLLEDVWRHTAPGLMEQAVASAAVIGTNRLRAEPHGPICGKLVAIGLRDSSDALIGLLIALRTEDQEKYSPRESQRLADLAGTVSPLLVRQPEKAAGLMTREEFDAHVMSRERAAKTLHGCLLYGDVDQLLVLNKLAGKAAGDRAIAAVSETMRAENLPDGARSCHLTGDRFVVYLPDATLPDARRLAEQLCRTVTERCSKLDGLRTRLSISFGIAAIPVGDDALAKALESAETTCKVAKRRGRGHVDVFEGTDQTVVKRGETAPVTARLIKPNTPV